MKNPLPVLFPTATRVVNAVRGVEPNQVVVRPEYPPPVAPMQPTWTVTDQPVMPMPSPTGLGDLRTYQMMQQMHHQIAVQHLHTIQMLTALGAGRPDNIQVYTTHNLDYSTHDNSTRVDARRWTKIDSRHIAAKNRLHQDWGLVFIIIFLLGLAIIGTHMMHGG